MAQHAVPLPQKMDRIKVLAAESTRMNSQLLAEALAQDCLLDVMGIEPKQAAILAAVAQHKPHVVLISSALEDSGTQGFDLARQISATCPGTRVILLMDNSHPASVVQAFRCGAHGIFSRTESSKSLAKCIHSVHQGQVWAEQCGAALRPRGAARIGAHAPGRFRRRSDPLQAGTRCGSLRGGRLVQPGDCKLPGTYRAHRQELSVSDFRQARRFQPRRGRAVCFPFPQGLGGCSCEPSRLRPYGRTKTADHSREDGQQDASGGAGVRRSGENLTDSGIDCPGFRRYCNPNPSAAVSTIVRPITSEAVAAGEGTLSTCSILSDGTN